MSHETVAREADGQDDRARWAALVLAELGIPAGVLQAVTDPVLEMVRDVAHQVNRPSAPLTAFLVGLASGMVSTADRTNPADAVRAQVALVTRLIEGWEPTPGA